MSEDGEGVPVQGLRAVDAEPEAPQATVAGTDPLEMMAMHLFGDRFGDRFRFNQTRGVWMEWTGLRWQVDELQRHMHEIMQLVDRMRRADPDARKPLGKISFSQHVATGARSLPVFSCRGEDFDSDPMLLGTPTGYIDLETGEHHRPDQSKMISKCLGVAPADEAKCPIWMSFMEEATKGRDGLLSYLQVFLGYSLSGLMKEEIMTFVYGPGGNGKGVMLKTIGSILGDFYGSTPASTFMEVQRNEHPTELADLQGKRLVSASETDDGSKWNLSRIKEITGNENPIKARFMRQDFFEFWPVCKLMIIGNNMPEIGNVDPAIARRLRLIEMTNLPKVVDNDLKDKLMPERAGILRWLLDGWAKYQKEGLNPPECVKQASGAYLAREDVVGAFLRDWFEFDQSRQDWYVLRSELSSSIKAYCALNGITKKVSVNRIYKTLTTTFNLSDEDTIKGKRCFKGMTITPEAYDHLKEWLDRANAK